VSWHGIARGRLESPRAPCQRRCPQLAGIGCARRGLPQYAHLRHCARQNPLLEHSRDADGGLLARVPRRPGRVRPACAFPAGALVGVAGQAAVRTAFGLVLQALLDRKGGGALPVAARNVHSKAVGTGAEMSPAVTAGAPCRCRVRTRGTE